MKRVLAVAALTLPILSACGEKGELPYIEVEGQAKLEKPAEVFEFKAKIVERSKERAQSLAAASEKLNEVRDQLGRMKGLESLVVLAGDMTVSTVRPENCASHEVFRREDHPENCDPLAQYASIEIKVKGVPASLAGNAISLLSELNAEEIDELTYKVKDPEQAASETREAALDRAMKTARTLAARADANVGSPLEIKYSDSGFRDDQIIVTGADLFLEKLPATIPETPVELPADKVTFKAHVKVKFALDKPRPEK